MMLGLSNSEAAGFATAAVPSVIFVAVCFRARRYGLVAWAVCGFPLLPLLTLYVEWGLVASKIIRRSSLGPLDGVLGFSQVGGMLCLLAYPVSLLYLIGHPVEGVRQAGRRVAVYMPVIWVAASVFSCMDPFGMADFFFR